MKRLLMTLICLVTSFICTWAYKTSNLADRPNAYAMGIDHSEGAWWLLSATPDLDENWVLDPEIPVNYIPLLGHEETYMVIGADGKVTQYRKRVMDSDGTWIWEDVEVGGNDLQPVDGLENVFSYVDDSGNQKYVKYIRNEDGTFAYVEVDVNGNEVEQTKTESGTAIPENYYRVSGNVYAVYDENGVVIGYRERVVDKDGNYLWIDSEKPAADTGSSTGNQAKTKTDTGSKQSSGDIIIVSPGISKEGTSDGGYVETETLVETKNTGGWRITYQTVITRTYDQNGKLLSTKKEGPAEIGKESMGQDTGSAPEQSKIESSIDQEAARVSAGILAEKQIASEVAALLNKERESAGLTKLKYSSDSTASKLAIIKAADMCIYNHADFDSPMYGTISQLMKRYAVSGNGSESLWKTAAGKQASDIHYRFQIQSVSQKARMDSGFTQIGIAVFEKNGYLYIAEVLL